jgi:arylsulfatase A-like enzyme
MRIAVLVGLLSLAIAPAAVAQEKKPNILFIAIDDLNDWVGVLGKNPQAKTPNIDKLAKRGVLFTRAYCAAPVCNPSRTALMTGQRPSSSGVYNNNQPWRPVLSDSVILPQYLRTHGYLAWGIGKILHFHEAKSWDGDTHPHDLFGKGMIKLDGIGGNMMWGPVDADDSQMADYQMVDVAAKKLKEKHDRPFFLAVGFHKPHLPWHCPQAYFDRHPLDKIVLPKVLDNDLDDVPPQGVKFATNSGDHKKIVAAGKWKDAVQAYLACSTFLDAQVGRLLDALAASPYADNTIIILWSDHGWSHGQKQHWRKFTLWEQDCRVVFTITAPGLAKAGQKCERTVSLIDLYPTIAELCGLPAPKGQEGHSIVLLLRNPQATWDHPAITTYGRNNHTVRTEHWRYIRYADGTDELYDEDNDPLEWRNLARDPHFNALREQLARSLPTVNAADAPKEKGKKTPD